MDATYGEVILAKPEASGLFQPKTMSVLKMKVLTYRSRKKGFGDDAWAEEARNSESSWSKADWWNVDIRVSAKGDAGRASRLTKKSSSVMGLPGFGSFRFRKIPIKVARSRMIILVEVMWARLLFVLTLNDNRFLCCAFSVFFG